MTLMRENQRYPHHPERFQHWKQLLCTNGLTGRFHWEVERKGKDADCCLGLSDMSWSVCCTHNHYSAFNNNRMRTICTTTSVSDRVGVYLDWPAGTLSFYLICSETLSHLHTFHCTFTEPVYPVFGFEYMIRFDSTVSLSDLGRERCLPWTNATVERPYESNPPPTHTQIVSCCNVLMYSVWSEMIKVVT